MPHCSLLHQQFRSATQTLHKELDSSECLAVLKGKNLRLDNYLSGLQSLYSPHALLENRVCEGIEQLNLDYYYQPRSRSLKEDILSLGGVCPGLAKTDFIGEMTVADLIGYLYLLEGSKLGSASIAMTLKRLSDTQWPTAFFDQPEADPASWQNYWALTNRTLLTAELTAHAIRAAQSAFRFYIDAIQQAIIKPVR